MTLSEPETVEQVVAVIQEAAARNRVLSFGPAPSELSPSESDIQPLSLHKMASVVDYPARDMTVTVQAGMTWGRLTEILKAENQQLPIDVAADDQTLGAIVAADLSGPRRYGYGTLRDYLIGMEAVDGQGRVFHAGGRVVKNVAGYDLCRLMVGSRCQLGVLTQLTFKLKPISVAQRLLVAEFSGFPNLDQALQQLNLSAARPVILDVINARAAFRLLPDRIRQEVGNLDASAAHPVSYLVFSVDGSPASCDWQIARLRDELTPTAAALHAVPRESQDSAEIVADYCRRLTAAQKPAKTVSWQFQLRTLPSRVVPALTCLADTECEVFGRAGNGVLFLRASQSPTAGKPSAASAAESMEAGERLVVQRLQGLMDDGIGELRLLTADVLSASRSFGTTPVPSSAHSETSDGPGLAIGQRLRHTFDPQQIFVARA